MNKEKENIYNLPNLLSFYRLISTPVLAYLVYIGEEKLFFYWFLFNMFTDVLDGFIARRFNLKTRMGAKLDSLADSFMYLLAFWAMYRLKWDELQFYKISFFLLVFYYFFIDFFSLIKFKEISRLHLFSAKTAGVIQGIFFLVLFTSGMNDWLYKLMFTVSTFSFIENLYFLIKLNQMQSNLKGIFWHKKFK